MAKKEKSETKDSKDSKKHSATDAGTAFERELEATAGGDLSLGLPLHVFLGEVIDVSKFVKTYWEPVSEGREKRPGLRSAKKNGFDLDIADELVALHALTQQAQTGVLLSVKLPESAEDEMENGRELLRIITGALEWCFDDDVEDDKDAQLAAAQSQYDDVTTIDALADALNGYAALAEKYADELDGLLEFKKSHIDEARKASAWLTDISPSLPVSPETTAALAHRNKLVELLHRRVKKVRKAARLVFEKFPNIAQQATSAYLRRARAALRRREKAAEPAKP